MKLLSLLFIAVMIFGSCASSKEPTGVWVNKEKIQGKSFNKVFIVVLTGNIAARVMLENDLASEAEAKGYTVVKSHDVLPPSLDNPKPPGKAEVVSSVKASGCDAVLVCTLLKKEEDVRYVAGSTAYSVKPYYSYYSGYYSQYYQTVDAPGYYSKEKNYFVETNLYDAATEEIMWSVQST